MQGHYNGVLQWERESGLSSEESRGEWELRVKETKMVGGGGLRQWMENHSEEHQG